MTTAIPVGPATSILQNVVYALPGKTTFLTSGAAIETSLNGTDWTAQADSVTGIITGSVFVRCTTGATLVVCANAFLSND